MGISYRKLWVKLAEHDMKRTDMAAACKISSGTLANLGKNERVSMETLEKICEFLDCNFGDIIDYVPDSGDNT